MFLSLLDVGIKFHWFGQIERIFLLIEFIMSLHGMLFKVEDGTSIFSTENHAIYEGVKLVNTLESNDILTISDSLSTLLALKNLSTKNEITLNIQTKLIETKKNIEFMWVPYAGIAGNERTDKHYTFIKRKLNLNTII